MQPCPFYILSMAALVHQQDAVLVTEIFWPTELKVFIIWFFFFLAAQHSIRDLPWHVGSSPTRDRTLTPCSGSTES